jgi:hypothetical protein
VKSSLALFLIPFAVLPSFSQDASILQVRVVEGEGAVYGVGSRATRGITVQVTDESGNPVDAATVSFRLPDEGPTGVFASGTRSEIATTRSDGRAGAWGMQWNRIAGAFEMRITVVKGPARAGTVCGQFLSNSPEAARTARVGPRSNHKWVWIALAVGGAAAGGVAAAAITGKAGTVAPTIIPGLQIGTPTIILGRP